jgi:hypothetical protein
MICPVKGIKLSIRDVIDNEKSVQKARNVITKRIDLFWSDYEKTSDKTYTAEAVSTWKKEQFDLLIKKKGIAPLPSENLTKYSIGDRRVRASKTGKTDNTASILMVDKNTDGTMSLLTMTHKTGKLTKVDLDSNYNSPKMDYDKQVIDGIYQTVSSKVKGIRNQPNKQLGSDIRGKAAELEGYAQEYGNLTNDPEQVKALAKELNRKSDVRVSVEHEGWLVDVVDMFIGKDKKFLPQNLQVYLNKKGPKSLGTFVPYAEEKIGAGIYITEGNEARVAGNQMGPMEKYVHELIHGAMYYGLESGDPEVAGARERLEKLYHKVVDKLVWQDLMPSGSDYDYKEEKKIAVAMLKHMRETDGLHEFITYGLTNENMIKKLQTVTMYIDKSVKAKNVWEALRFMAQDLIDMIMSTVRKETVNTTGHKLLIKLSMDIAKANNTAAKTYATFTMGEKAGEFIDKLNGAINNVTDKLKENQLDKDLPKLPANATKLETAKWLAGNLSKMVMDDRMRPHYEAALTAAGLKPEGITQQLIRAFSQDDNLQRTVERLGLLSMDIDDKRFAMGQAISSTIRSAWKGKLSKADNELVTEVLLDNDIQVLGNTGKGISKLFSSDTEVTKQIDKYRKVIIDKAATKADANYYLNEAKGLARYLLTHKASEIQLLNANNIARQLGTANQVDKADPALVEAIDKLSSLTALKDTDAAKKDRIKELFESEPDGIHTVLNLHKGFVADTREKLFSDNDINYIKGYTKEIFDADIDIKVAKISDKKDMIAQGYQFIAPLVKSELDNTRGEFALYRSNLHALQGYNKQAFRTTDTAGKGTTIADILYKTNLDPKFVKIREKAMIAEISGNVETARSKWYESEFDELPISNMVPVYNKDGKVITYRYMMSKAEKKNLLAQDTRANLVLGQMYANNMDKVSSGEMNKKVINTVLEDMEDNYIPGKTYGKNGKEYIMVGPDGVVDDKYKEMWRLLPSAAKHNLEQKAKELLEEDETFKGIAVRRDLVRQYFGERDFSIGDTRLMGLSPKVIRQAVVLAERIWKSIVGIAKANIVIKTPAVLFGNIISNLVLSVQLGMDPLSVLKLQWSGLKDLQAYKKTEGKLNELAIKISSNKAQGKPYKALEAQVKVYKKELNRNPAHVLIKEGLFSSIVEDVNPEDRRSNDPVGRWIDKKTENWPEVVKQGTNYLYLTERTAPYQMMLTATQYSDFIARYGLYHGTKKKQERAIESKHGRKTTPAERKKLEDSTLELVTNAFINYNTLDNKYVKYANDMGLVMFTKFFVGIQQVLKKGLADKPVNFILAMLGQVLLFDVEDITEHSVITKNYEAILHNPLEIMREVYTPSSIELLSVPHDVIQKLAA